MLLRRIPSIVAMILMAGVVSCSSETNPVAPLPAPQQTGDGFLTIHDARVVYANPNQFEAWATVENHTDRLFYARLGVWPGEANQSTLHAGAGSNGFLEQWDPPSWRSLPRYLLIEGVWVVELRPHSTYTLVGGTFHSAPDRVPTPGDAPAFDSRRPRASVLRFRVQYFDDAAMSPDKAHQDYSNTFVLTRPPTP